MTTPIAAIVGVGPGIGLAVARRFAKGGMDLALISRDMGPLEGFRDTLAPIGGKVHLYECDAGEHVPLAKVFQEIREHQGTPDALVYNASVMKEVPASRVSPEGLAREFRTNCLGALVSAHEVLPGMRKRGRGSILFTGGGLALKPHHKLASLSIGKGAVRTLALMLAEELEPEGIHVATVTVDGFVQPGTRLDPDTIAEEFWKLHRQPPGAWTREVVLSQG
ncbi:MAG: SDR family NAD(P)-dependent oxidoreductase [Acidobacteria bacterium]|nr:SDR family NAD(P)-dependent oxidoreductase [Acidobacteriota bacterium]